MKELIHNIQEALKSNDETTARTLFIKGASQNPSKFLRQARKSGMFRFAMYDYHTKIICALLSSLEKNTCKTLTIEEISYISSVQALAKIADCIRPKLSKFRKAINSRSFKTYLASVHFLFLQEYQKKTDKVTALWESFSKEEISDGFSYYYHLLIHETEFKDEDLNVVYEKKGEPHFYFNNLAFLASIVRFREIEMMIEAFSYTAEVKGRTVIINSGAEKLEKYVRFGYIRHQTQQNTDLLQNRCEGMTSIVEMAKMFSAKFGEKFFELVEKPHRRIRILIPEVERFTKTFRDYEIFLEDHLTLSELRKNIFFGDDKLLLEPIFKTITLHDLLKYQRFLQFLSLAFDEFCRSHSLNGSLVHIRSLVTNSSPEEACYMAKTFCGINHPEHLFEVICFNPEEGRIFDLLYTPVLKVKGKYIIPFAVIAYSNIVRNALQRTRYRFDSEGTNDALSDMLFRSFAEVQIQAWTHVSYANGNERGEIDVLAVFQNHIFVFECKNSLHPCNAFELRQSYGYIQDASEQLKKSLHFLSSSSNAEKIKLLTGVNFSEIAGITTCIVTGNRMFNMYRTAGIPVRNIHEVCNAILGGNPEFIAPVKPENPNSPKERFTFHASKSDKPTKEELISYFDGVSIGDVTLDSMCPIAETTDFGGCKLKFETFHLDLIMLADKLRKHPLVTVHQLGKEDAQYPERVMMISNELPAKGSI